MPSAGQSLLPLLIIIGLGLAFDFINGFHDTANAIATVVGTRWLSPGRAVAMAGVLNFVGALSGTAVATTVGKGIVPPHVAMPALIISSLLAAIVWNLMTWYAGLPSSSSHALIFSIVGAGVAQSGWSVVQPGGLNKTIEGLIFSPLLGFLSAFVLMVLLLNLCERVYPTTVTRVFGRTQLISAAYMAFSHGSNDAQKTMGVITMALANYHGWTGENWKVPLWVIAMAATAMGLGTSIGGWRIVRTMGLRVVQLRPIHGFAAETAAALVDGDRGRKPPRHSGFHHAYHQLGDPRRRCDASAFGGTMGGGGPDRAGLDIHDSRLLRAGVDDSRRDHGAWRLKALRPGCA